jgi:hypothetical protein
MFTPAVKSLQEWYRSRRQYARIEGTESSPARLGPQESEFIGERDTFYMALEPSPDEIAALFSTDVGLKFRATSRTSKI